MIIAIDGSAASGKGTLAKRLATHLGLSHLDTGALYRAVSLQLLNAGQNPKNINANQCVRSCVELDIALTTSPLIRSEKVAEMASVVAAMPAVRAALLDLQRHFAATPPDPKGAILDGRDIGTVICPDATYKFFVDADLEVRAARRVKELLERGVEAIYARVLQDMRERDARDSTRKLAPLVPAEDAFVIDTTKINAEAAFTAALEWISEQNKSKA